ncbi:pancreatic progenitor cell differentiation and proliferation factor-like [Cynocephalus volans]|uniref:pancreatic progenitor cell differentiation and proliferation factor-like n=1 Tax=Cynocephalus volans TaxID=110931 RepID=UPI002FC614BE
MAAIPSSGSLMATHNYYWHRLSSTSSNSSCGSADYSGEALPLHPGLPIVNPAHWWVSFFFRKSMLPFMAMVLKTPEHLECPQASSSMITCGLAHEATRTQCGQPSTASTRPLS